MSVVKLQEKRTRNKYVSYLVTIPKGLVELLNWKPGDKLVLEYVEKEGKKGVFIYKP